MAAPRHDRRPLEGEPAASQLRVARPYAERRISRQGNSLMIGIPGAFLRNLNLLPGDYVRVILYEEHGGFLVQPVMRRAQIPPPPVEILPPGNAGQ
jgi:hypothetical protein